MTDAMTRSIFTLLVLGAFFAVTCHSYAQEVPAAVEATPVEDVAEAITSEVEAPDEVTEIAEEPAPSEDASEAPAPEESLAEEPVIEEDTAAEDPDSEEAAEETEAGYDYGALIARSPDFFAVMHPAVIHFPIALWFLGAMFVVIGLFVPTWRQQIPITCLLIGTMGAIVASVTGWWYADFQGYAEWNEIDWEDGLCRHRWIGVGLALASVFLSMLALYSAKAESWFGGFLWRTGLILLALAVGYEGHIGGELIHSTSIEEAFVEWINPAE